MIQRIDKYSDTWKAIEKWAQEQITSLREKNDSPRLNDIKTSFIRGKIKAFKDLIDLKELADATSQTSHQGECLAGREIIK